MLEFALGILCVLAVGALVVLISGIMGGTGSKVVLDRDRTDADPERVKAVQYMMRNKSQPPSGGGARFGERPANERSVAWQPVTPLAGTLVPRAPLGMALCGTSWLPLAE